MRKDYVLSRPKEEEASLQACELIMVKGLSHPKEEDTSLQACRLIMEEGFTHPKEEGGGEVMQLPKRKEDEKMQQIPVPALCLHLGWDPRVGFSSSCSVSASSLT